MTPVLFVVEIFHGLRNVGSDCADEMASGELLTNESARASGGHYRAVQYRSIGSDQLTDLLARHVEDRTIRAYPHFHQPRDEFGSFDRPAVQQAIPAVGIRR